MHTACGETLIKLYESCLGGEGNEALQVLLYNPLETVILGEANKFAQMGAARCMCLVIEKLRLAGKSELLEQICPQFVSTFTVRLPGEIDA